MSKPDDNSITVHVPQPRPVTDPVELKQIAMREYRGKLERAGRAVSEAALERFVVQELNLVDAFGRIHPTRKAPRLKAERSPTPELHAKERGLKLWRGDRQDPDVTRAPLVTRTPPWQMGELVAAAVARIGRLLEHDQALKSTSVDQMIAATEAPKLAREYMQLWSNYQMRHLPTRLNPFFGMSDRDAARKFIRGIFDICDRSTGIAGLGHWHLAVRR